MARRSRRDSPETLRIRLIKLLENFAENLEESDLREQVRALVPVNHLLRDLGSSLVTDHHAASARDRMLLYLRKYVRVVIDGDELMVVAGISDYPRRLRELRVQLGWSILTGVTVNEMRKNAAEEDLEEFNDLPNMRPDQYLLQFEEADREAAFRWNLANEIRKKKGNVHDKILTFLRANLGSVVSGEELRYVAGNKSEWARRVRELRTEHGWAVTTKQNGNPALPVGTYVLTSDKQSPQHDRKIKDRVRREVLQRDAYVCQRCGWTQERWNPADPRNLELHHMKHHAKGGTNSKENLMTYCNICHDAVHEEEGSKET